MKRASRLYSSIAGYENMRLAFCKAARGKHDRPEVLSFTKNLASNLEFIRQQLITEQPDIGHYRFFRVRDPKPRAICAASFPERVLHHAIMNICEPALERYAIYDSYACRKGKGTIKAIERARKFSRRNRWYLKLDIRRYFDSIDHNILLSLLHRRFKDRQLLALFEKIIATYHLIPGKGLPIGNLISQHLANYYLGYLDHWVKEELREPYYLRYMDDFLLFAESKRNLQQRLAQISSFLGTRLQLRLKNNIQLNRCGYGIPFLGFRVYPHVIRLGPRSKKRFREKYQKYERHFLAGIWTEPEFIRHIEALFGFTLAASSKSYRNHVIQRYGVLS